MFASPGEIFIKIGGFPIYFYGIFMAIALCVWVLVSTLVAKKDGIAPEKIYDISPFIIVGGILGARIYYCILNFGYYFNRPIEILHLWQGGISIHGALFGGVVAGVIYAKKNNLPILKLCDTFSYGIILAQAIGRWGNFFNSEAFGLPTNLAWKLFVPIEKRPSEFVDFSYFHPTFLYESIWNIFVFLILYFIIRKLVKKYATSIDGLVFCSYLVLYSIGRLLIEQIRIDSAFNFFTIPIAQIVSVAIILLAITFGIFLCLGYNKRCMEKG